MIFTAQCLGTIKRDLDRDIVRYIGVTHTQKGGGVQIQTLGSDPKNTPTNLSQIKQGKGELYAKVLKNANNRGDGVTVFKTQHKNEGSHRCEI